MIILGECPWVLCVDLTTYVLHTGELNTLSSIILVSSLFEIFFSLSLGVWYMLMLSSRLISFIVVFSFNLSLVKLSTLLSSIVSIAFGSYMCVYFLLRILKYGFYPLLCVLLLYQVNYFINTWWCIIFLITVFAFFFSSVFEISMLVTLFTSFIVISNICVNSWIFISLLLIFWLVYLLYRCIILPLP